MGPFVKLARYYGSGVQLGGAALRDEGYFALAGEGGFSGNYDDLTNKPVLFDGAYASLSGKPVLGDSASKNVGAGAGDVAAGDHTHPGGSEAFPVGSVFIAVVSTNPGTLLGYGTWSAFAAGRVLVGLDSGQIEFDTVKETGGAKDVTLTAAQSGLPQHTHVQDAHNHTQNSHTHVITSQTATTGSATSYEHGTLDTSSAEAEATEVTGATTATNQTATAVNQNAGPTAAAQAHTNLQPYIVVYMWERTA